MIAPNDGNILYSPYNWDVMGVRAKTITAGAYFKVLIGGSPSSVVLNFDLTGVSAPLPQIEYEIDGIATVVEVAATVTVPLPTRDTWGTRTLKVTVEATSETVNRWTSQANAVQFTGITTSGTAVASVRRPRRVLVLGDSITEGVRTLNMNAATDVLRNSAIEAWSYQLGDTTGAEVGVVGFGGTGVVKATGSGSVPNLAGYWNTMWSGGPDRGVTATPPDWIVINQGTNDGTTDITSAYTSVLNSMLAATPSTTLIFCLRPFGGSHAAEIQAAAAATTAPSRCIYVDTAGWWSSADSSDNLHPYGYTAPALASRAASTILSSTLTAPATQTAVGYIFDMAGNAVPMSVAA